MDKKIILIVAVVAVFALVALIAIGALASQEAEQKKADAYYDYAYVESFTVLPVPALGINMTAEPGSKFVAFRITIKNVDNEEGARIITGDYVAVVGNVQYSFSPVTSAYPLYNTPGVVMPGERGTNVHVYQVPSLTDVSKIQIKYTGSGDYRFDDTVI